MSVSRDEILRLAALARLRLDTEELDGLAHDLNRILEHVDELAALPDAAEPSDADGVPSSPPPLPDEPDALRRPLSDVAPEWRDGFFAVPPPPGVET